MRQPMLSGLTVTALALAAGCASRPPNELVDARRAYQQAKAGPAAEYTPAQLHTAESSLVLAEQTYADEGDSASTRDRAYVAKRKAELATVQARVAIAENRLAKAAADERRKQTRELTEARAELADQRDALVAERARRAEAEQRAQQAAADLARVASVKQEDRGMVITLSGGVLFASGKASLLPSAQAKLSEVADALSESAPDSAILVEGHTDSQGSARFNQELSSDRANAVRAYLVSHGVAADRIRAEGLGFTRPVADNGTPEGRANNRRVEIVVQPPVSSSKGEGLPGAPPGDGVRDPARNP
ncbi:MAG: OmpA family protein [Myxococcales bacterium]